MEENRRTNCICYLLGAYKHSVGGIIETRRRLLNQKDIEKNRCSLLDTPTAPNISYKTGGMMILKLLLGAQKRKMWLKQTIIYGDFRAGAVLLTFSTKVRFVFCHTSRYHANCGDVEKNRSHRFSLSFAAKRATRNPATAVQVGRWWF